MKLFLWIIVGFVTLGLAFWIVTTSENPQNSFLMILVVLVFGVPPLGAFWMLYMAIRYEKHPLPMMILAFFVPYTFLWYYFERVRPRKHISGDDLRSHLT